MHCPFCSYKSTKVLESRTSQASLRRRRECLKCSNRFTTYEKAEFHFSVIKKNKREEPFNISKIRSALEKACYNSSKEEVELLTRKIEQKVLRKKINPIKSTLIGRVILQELKKHDKMAYLRFASVYKEITDPKMLEKELKTIVS